MSRHPHIELRLLRCDDGLHPGMCAPINIFDFPDGEPPVVFLETDFAVQEVSSQKTPTRTSKPSAVSGRRRWTPRRPPHT